MNDDEVSNDSFSSASCILLRSFFPSVFNLVQNLEQYICSPKSSTSYFNLIKTNGKLQKDNNSLNEALTFKCRLLLIAFSQLLLCLTSALHPLAIINKCSIFSTKIVAGLRQRTTMVSQLVRKMRENKQWVKMIRKLRTPHQVRFMDLAMKSSRRNISRNFRSLNNISHNKITQRAKSSWKPIKHILCLSGRAKCCW